MSQPSTAGVSFLRRSASHLGTAAACACATCHSGAGPPDAPSLPPQQLGDVGGDAPGLIAAQPVWSHRQQAIDLGQGPAVRLVIRLRSMAGG